SGGYTRIRFKPNRLHRTDRTLLVDVRGIASDAHSTDDLTALITDQHAPRRWHQLTAGEVVHRPNKSRTLLSVGGNQARALTQRQCPPGLANGNLWAQQAGTVFTLQADQVPAGIQYRHRQRCGRELPTDRQSAASDGGRDL